MGLCPVNNENYAFIGDICYFFEINPKNYQDAKANCVSKFGNRVGQLFEPRNIERNNEVRDKAKVLSNSNWWIGVSDSVTEGTYQFETSKDSISFQIKTAPWDSSQPDGGEHSGGEEDCVAIKHPESLWHDMACSYNFPSVCEST